MTCPAWFRSDPVRTFLRLASVALGAIALFSHAAVAALPSEISWAGADIFAPAGWSRPEEKALALLVDETSRRTGVRSAVSREWRDGTKPLVVIVSAASRDALGLPDSWRRALPEPPDRPESFAIRSTELGGRPALLIVGRDARGVLFGAGHVLRKMTLAPGRAVLPRDFAVATTPAARWRGHQLGYRPKTNSYDGWDVADWEQYIRDLVVFGLNAIELVPPRSDDAATSPHFPLPPLAMMRAMSQLAADYGLECWIWYPAIDPDYTDPATRATARAEWEEVFRALPRIDAVFVPGGDPGRTPPGVLMGLLEEQAALLRRHHPAAGLWISPQGFSSRWLDEWLQIVRQEPAWMTGVVYGPWTRRSLPDLRAAVPRRYPLRLYPDITHNFLSQLPVPDWDRALASTLGREAINPRPENMANVARRQLPLSDGFIAYSEGCNDDVNKAVWSALAWDPATPVAEILADYSRYFISPALAPEFGAGLAALERNWQGALAVNEGVEATLAAFQRMEAAAPMALRRNWRFQQALYRASYDAHVRRRLLAETEQERHALALLDAAAVTGAVPAMAAAETALFAPPADAARDALRTRIFQLAEALFQSAKMQLSVPLYGATALPRGANLDAIDFPLNNRGWLQARFAEIRTLATEEERLAALRGIVHWTDPGPGGYYRDLGHEAAPAGDSLGDPEFRSHPLPTFSVRTGRLFEGWRAAWWDHLSAFYGSSVELEFNGLDPAATYDVRVVYVPTFLPSEIRLETDEGLVVHAGLALGRQESAPTLQPQTFPVPPAATRDGRLRLKWTVNPDAGQLVGFGQVGEMWLVRRMPAP